MWKIRTDLALEAKESFPGDGGEVPGVALEEKRYRGIKMTRVRILDENGAAAMKKPIGTYLTLEAAALASEEEGERQKTADALEQALCQLLEELDPKGRFRSVLAVGLGNDRITADALGPLVMDSLRITRCLPGECAWRVSAIVPGVMAQTGMETAEILKGIVRETGPDLVLVVDALAARSITRLGTTIQLTDTGIQPGSGVGNHRSSLTRESLGVPVIAIGVPTVVGAAAIVFDTAAALEEVLRAEGREQEAGQLESMSEEERYFLIRELLEPKFGPMYVTPKDIDLKVQQISAALALGLNRTFSGSHRKG